MDGPMQGIRASLWLNINEDLCFLFLGRLQIEVLVFSSDCPEDCVGATVCQPLQFSYQYSSLTLWCLHGWSLSLLCIPLAAGEHTLLESSAKVMSCPGVCTPQRAVLSGVSGPECPLDITGPRLQPHRAGRNVGVCSGEWFFTFAPTLQASSSLFIPFPSPFLLPGNP